MFKYRFACSDEDAIRLRIKQRVAIDVPYRKSIFGRELYGCGIHFQECDKVIKGFYLEQPEGLSRRGSPIRLRFRGRFVREKDGNCFFEVYIYPRILEVLFLTYAFLALSFCGKIVEFAISAVVLMLFVCSYYRMINETCDEFNRVFR